MIHPVLLVHFRFGKTHVCFSSFSGRAFVERNVAEDVLDDYDKNTLMAEVNTMTSQKMSIANKISQDRVAEMDKLHKETMAKYGR